MGRRPTEKRRLISTNLKDLVGVAASVVHRVWEPDHALPSGDGRTTKPALKGHDAREPAFAARRRVVASQLVDYLGAESTTYTHGHKKRNHTFG